MKRRTKDWWLAQRPEVVGKETEKMVEEVLKDLNRKVDFAWHRLPDARSARSALAAQPADYMICVRGRLILLDAKALKHETRITKSGLSQLPTMHKFYMAGAVVMVLTHHYTIGKWRVVNAANLTLGEPSWNIEGCPTFDSHWAAITHIGGPL